MIAAFDKRQAVTGFSFDGQKVTEKNLIRNFSTK